MLAAALDDVRATAATGAKVAALRELLAEAAPWDEAIDPKPASTRASVSGRGHRRRGGG